MSQPNPRQAPASLAWDRRPSARRPVIVCGLDGSAGCVEISRIASRLAARLGGRVEYVHVLDGAAAERRMDAQAMLDTAIEGCDAPATARLLEFGDPARRVAAIAESARAGLIVVGAHEHGTANDAVLGSVSGRLSADAPCPVLVVPFGVQHHVRPSTWWARTIVCGYDGSPAAWRSAVNAARLAAGIGGSVSLLSVGAAVPWSMAQVTADLAERLARPGPDGGPTSPPRIAWELRGGDPAWELEAVAAANTAPLIAIGSRGDGRSEGPLLGATARQLLRSARRPILVTPAATSGRHG